MISFSIRGDKGHNNAIYKLSSVFVLARKFMYNEYLGIGGDFHWKNVYGGVLYFYTVEGKGDK